MGIVFQRLVKYSGEWMMTDLKAGVISAGQQ